MNKCSLWQVLATYAVVSWAVYQVAMGLRDGLGLAARLPLYAFILMLVGLPIVVATWFVQRRLAQHPHLDDNIHKHLTWRRTLIGGGLAFSALAIVTAVVTIMHHRGTLLAQGILKEDDPVLLADFASGQDSVLGHVITEALRVDLLQSQSLRIAQPTAIAAGLRRMNRSGLEPLTAALAQELAQREGFKAVITGDVTKVAGATYLLTARVVTPRDSILVAFSESAKDSTEIIPAVNRLSQKMREKIGESLTDIRASIPLQRVTTSSFPALTKYTEAIRIDRESGDRTRVAQLLEEAVALDSMFASAWRKLGVRRETLAGRSEALTKAYALRDRLPEVERYQTIGTYMFSVKKDRRAAMDAYRMALEHDSMDAISLANLPQLLIRDKRMAEAEVLLKRALRSDQINAAQYNMLAAAQYQQGHLDDAKATIAAAQTALPNNYEIYLSRIAVATIEYQYDSAQAIVREGMEKFRDNVSAQKSLLEYQASLSASQGRLRESREMRNREYDFWLGTVPPSFAFAIGAAGVFQTSMTLGDRAAAAREMDALFRKYPLSSMPESERPYEVIAWFHIAQKDAARAGPMIAAALKADPNFSGHTSMQGAYALLKGDAQGAIALQREAAKTEGCNECNADILAQAYMAVGQRDSAIKAIERYLSSYEDRTMQETVIGPNLFWAAQLHDEAGDTANAIRRYSDFIKLWQRADPELQPRVTSARQRIERLRGKG